ncbi:MAG: hypothetical protein M1834_007901 [Cirrosporium novae-zelandiae]|nr:MAG: hypothetical protein M1834_007901 [Cirrosporium novae-zelandiae]
MEIESSRLPSDLPVSPETAIDGLTSTLSTLTTATPSMSEPSTGPSTEPSTESCSEPPSDSSTPLSAHRSHDPRNNLKRSDPFQFGSRYLLPQDDVYEFNAWDHVTPDPAYDTWALSQYSLQKASPVTPFDFKRFNDAPHKWWDKFYGNNKENFFKDRKWLWQEFPILRELSEEKAGKKNVLEVGAGAGNTAFPLLRSNKNPELHIRAVDYSKKAVEVMRNSPLYPGNESKSPGSTNDVNSEPVPPLTPAIGTMEASIWDLSSTSPLDLPAPPSSIDVIILIFVLSALSPTQWIAALNNVNTLLKPGGVILFRDYGRGDLAQVRFKKGRWMGDNFYVRGDGTRVYFFAEDEIRQIFGGEITKSNTTNEKATPDDSSTKSLDSDAIQNPEETMPKFDILHLGVDRRLLVNRQRKLKMYRCWLQGKFQKPFDIEAEKNEDAKSPGDNQQENEGVHKVGMADINEKQHVEA